MMLVSVISALLVHLLFTSRWFHESKNETISWEISNNVSTNPSIVSFISVYAKFNPPKPTLDVDPSALQAALNRNKSLVILANMVPVPGDLELSRKKSAFMSQSKLETGEQQSY